MQTDVDAEASQPSHISENQKKAEKMWDMWELGSLKLKEKKEAEAEVS